MSTSELVTVAALSAAVLLLGAVPVVVLWASATGRLDGWWQRAVGRPVRPAAPFPSWAKPLLDWSLALMITGIVYHFVLLFLIWPIGWTMERLGLMDGLGYLLWVLVAGTWVPLLIGAKRWISSETRDNWFS